MNDWSITAKTEPYKKALAATESLGDPAVGFINPKEVPQGTTTTSTVIRQNNTIIQLLVKISEGIEDIKKVVTDRTSTGTSSDISRSLADLQNNFQKLSLGEPIKPKPKPKGPLFVFKDPLKIFEEERKKLNNNGASTSSDSRGKSKALDL